jgi:hypothetical protein
MTTIISQCYWCKHYEQDTKWKAFGDKRIPNAVFLNDLDHKEPFEWDGGIQFEPKKPGEISILTSPEKP